MTLSAEQGFYFCSFFSPSLMATYCVSAQSTGISEKLCLEERSWIAVAGGQSWGFQGILAMHCFTFKNVHILDFKKRLNL